MAYRDDADAARARADALAQDLEQTRRELAESDEESDELRDKLARAEKEAKRYRKLADKLERKVEGKPPRGLIIGIAVATVALGAIIAMVNGSRRRSYVKQSPSSTPSTYKSKPYKPYKPYKHKPSRRELQRQYIDSTFKYFALRTCFDHVDQRVHAAWSIYRDLKPAQLSYPLRSVWPMYFHRNGLRCARVLDGLEAKKPALADVDPLLAGYRKAVTAMLPLIAANVRYYGAGTFKRDKFAWGRKTLADTRAQLRSFVQVSLALRKAYGHHREAFARSDIEHAAKMEAKSAVAAVPVWHAMTAMFDAMVLPETTTAMLRQRLAGFDTARKPLERYVNQDDKVLSFQAQLDRVSASMAEHVRALDRHRNAELRTTVEDRSQLVHACEMAWGAYFSGYLISEGWYRSLKL